MNKLPALPSYATYKSPADFDPDRLKSGSYQDEATDFFLSVVEQFGGTGLNETFCNLFEQVHGEGSVAQYERYGGRFLSNTVALAVCKDIKPLAPYMLNDNIPLGTVSFSIRQNFRSLEVDYIQRYLDSGDIPLDMFCMLFDLRKEDLGQKIVLDDNAEAFAKLKEQDNDLSLKALANIPFDPFSKVRGVIVDQSGTLIEENELRHRYKWQLSALYSLEHMKLHDPKSPHVLRPQKLHCQKLDSVDHGVRHLPGYLDILVGQDEFCISQFSFLSTMQGNLSQDQSTLLKNLMDDFERAGMSRPEILVAGTLRYDYADDDFFSRLPKLEINSVSANKLAENHFKGCSAEQKLDIYHKVLLRKAVEYSEDPQGWKAEARLRQINYLISKEPITLMESLCTEEAHWNVLYRATGNKKYLENMPGRLDKALEADLGI